MSFSNPEGGRVRPLIARGVAMRSVGRDHHHLAGDKHYRDSLIAATAAEHGPIVATRNVQPMALRRATDARARAPDGRIGGGFLLLGHLVGALDLGDLRRAASRR